MRVLRVGATMIMIAAMLALAANVAVARAAAPGSSKIPPTRAVVLSAWLPAPAVIGNTASPASSVPSIGLVRGGLSLFAQPGLTMPAADRIVRLDPGWSFNLVAALVRLKRPYDPRFVLSVRTSNDALHWSTWQRLTFDSSDAPAESVSADNTCSEPLWIGSARYLDYRVGETAVDFVPAAHDLRFAFVNTMGNGTTPVSAGGTASTGAISLASATQPQTSVTRMASLSSVATVSVPSEPPIVTRAQWGANESWLSGVPGDASLYMAFLHHTDTTNDYTAAEAPAIIRAIYYYHTKVLGWDDIGYNFLIDKYGTIYEGRAGSITANVIGAQVLGFNTHSMGVALLGTYVNVSPTAAQLTSLEKLLAWKFDVNGIDPLGETVMTCGTTEKFKVGQQVTLPTIAGHRDANYTACPGADAYALLPQIRTAVAAIDRPKLLSLTLSAKAFDPTGATAQSDVAIAGTLAAPAAWTITVCDDNQLVVATFSGSGTQLAATWNGRTAAGAVLPDGTYTVTASATNVGITGSPRRVPIAIVTVPPQVIGFSPALGLVGDSFEISGTNFIGTSVVSFGGVPAMRFAVISPTLIRATVPVGASGAGPIVVTTPAGSVTSAVSFTVMAKPTLTLKLGGLAAGGIRFGQSFSASGALAPPSLAGSAVVVTVQRELYGKWLAVTSLVRATSPSATYVVSYKPAKLGVYRVKTTSAASTTNPATTTMWQTFTVSAVKPTLTLKLGGLTAGSIALGKSLIMSGALTPASLAGSAVVVTVQRELYGKWLAVTSLVRATSASSTYSAGYKTVKLGTYRVKTTIAATMTRASATTMWQTFTVK